MPSGAMSLGGGGGTKADVLEVELTYTLERQRGASVAKGKATRGDSKSLSIKRVWSSPRISNEVHMQGFNVREFIIREYYPEAGELVGSLISWNALPKEILNVVRQ